MIFQIVPNWLNQTKPSNHLKLIQPNGGLNMFKPIWSQTKISETALKSQTVPNCPKPYTIEINQM